MKKTLAVGHFLNADFQSACARHLGRIRETFFAWPGVLSCRPAPDFTPEVRERMVSDLKWARANGILLDGREPGPRSIPGLFVSERICPWEKLPEEYRSIMKQSDADRAAHKAVPISIALTLAGSIESIVITVNVQV